MKRYLIFILFGVLGTGILGACAANRGLTVDERFWEDKGAKVGIVLASLPDPDVTIKTWSTTMSKRDQTHTMSRRYQQDFDKEPAILKDQRELWHYLNSHEVAGLSSATDIMGIRLEAHGYRPVRIEGQVDPEQLRDYTPETSGYADKDYRDIPGVRGLDLLIILNVKKYGSYCYYVDGLNIYTDVIVELAGEMVDLRTNRLMWRSPFMPGRLKRTVSCMCEDAGTYPQILEELGGALDESAARIADDFFSSAPK